MSSHLIMLLAIALLWTVTVTNAYAFTPPSKISVDDLPKYYTSLRRYINHISRQRYGKRASPDTVFLDFLLRETPENIPESRNGKLGGTVAWWAALLPHSKKSDQSIPGLSPS